MSTIYRCSKKCAVCKFASKQSVIVTTNLFGSPDLDLRPPEGKRSTMVYWLEKCPSCGYVSYSIDQETTITKEWLLRPEYICCEGRSFKSNLSADFYKVFLIAQELDDVETAFNALMNAAWACDDQRDTENAVFCRKTLLPYLEKHANENPQASETLAVIKADVLRRAGLFDQIIAEYSDLTLSEKMMNAIIVFQVDRAKEKDTSCYTLIDVQNS